jgi:CHAP domain/Putative peptidoglycan binding domain
MQYPKRVIKIGEADTAIVVALQQQLLARGCGPVDAPGVFGPKTKASVKLFQSRNVDQEGRPLKPDGEIGSLTWAPLFGDETVPAKTGARSPFLEAVLAKAASQVGVMEQPKNSNSGPQVDEYLRRAGVPLDLPSTSKPWCCAFVYWCFDETAEATGRPNPMVRTAGCLDHWSRAERGGHRVAAARAVDDPSLIEPGMVFIMDYRAGRGHTGFVEQVAGGILHTIEGNTDASRTREGGGVYRLARKIVDVNTGFIDYGGS